MQKQSEEVLWYNFNMAEERELKKATKWIQKLCRGSLEYDLWQGRTKAGHQKCPVCSEFYGYLPAETHHYPKTMYDICEDVMTTFMMNDELNEQTGFGICTHIMNMHFMGMVDYIVLCKSCHEKFHAGHPEVCTIVGKEFMRQKEGKPPETEATQNIIFENKIQAPTKTYEIERATDDNLKSNGTSMETQIDLSLPPLPTLVKFEDEVKFINQNGIEIDI